MKIGKFENRIFSFSLMMQNSKCLMRESFCNDQSFPKTQKIISFNFYKINSTQKLSQIHSKQLKVPKSKKVLSPNFFPKSIKNHIPLHSNNDSTERPKNYLQGLEITENQAIPDNLYFGGLDFGLTPGLSFCFTLGQTFFPTLGDPLFGYAHDLCSGILGERP